MKSRLRELRVYFGLLPEADDAVDGRATSSIRERLAGAAVAGVVYGLLQWWWQDESFWKAAASAAGFGLLMFVWTSLAQRWRANARHDRRRPLNALAARS